MTRNQIKAFVVELLDGFEMPETLFTRFLDIAQMYWEGQRPWVLLRAEDTTQTVTTANTYETAKTLPTDFRKWYTRFPIVLTDAQGNPQSRLVEIPINLKSQYRTDPSRFYCNYATQELFICGAPGSSLTVRQYYIRRGTRISAAAANTWDLDVNDEYTTILGLSVAVYHKLGVDYDIINNAQADANASLARQIFNIMTDWDAELAESGLNGQTYGTGGGGHFGADGLSGSISMLG